MDFAFIERKKRENCRGKLHSRDVPRYKSEVTVQSVKMPAAANGKVEKPASAAENALPDNGNGASTPLRQAITVIEHKIRNLEKRKVSGMLLKV